MFSIDSQFTKQFFVFLAILFYSFSAHFSLAGESPQLADQAVAAHCKTPECANQLRALIQNTQGLTRNIGHEDPQIIQGPNNSVHPASRAACYSKVIATGKISQNRAFEQKCGAKWMAPVPERGQPASAAKVCIDQFEFPNLPCEYPVVWTSFRAAHNICRSMGKRLCNSFEWEGACAGSIEKNYPFSNQRQLQNNSRENVWAFNWISSLAHITDSRSICGVYSANDSEMDPQARANSTGIGTSRGCDPGVSPMRTCGTNTWPAGFKDKCVSPLGVYDMHGNVAEVTNLPTGLDTIADSFGRTGVNEHKGSFFVYRGNYPDDCRIRQPAEHQTTMANDRGHAFYQEGFRCCKDVE